MDDTLILDLLGTQERAVPACLLQREATTNSVFGLYSWWADDEARTELGVALGQEIPPLIYIGQAGAGSSTRSLWARIAGNHISGTVRTSTFRFTLTAILAREGSSIAPSDGGVRPTDAQVTEWIKEHLSVLVVPVDDRLMVNELEGLALRRYDPPLNLQGMPPTAGRRRLSALRATLGRR